MKISCEHFQTKYFKKYNNKNVQTQRRQGQRDEWLGNQSKQENRVQIDEEKKWCWKWKLHSIVKNLIVKAANTMEHVSNRSSVMEDKMEKLTGLFGRRTHTHTHLAL